jgi:hypothetical protein
MVETGGATYPANEFKTLNKAVAYRLLEVAEPAKALWKLAYGSCTLCTLPLRTTHPVTTMKRSRTTFITPIAFIPRTPQLGNRMWIKVIKLMAAMAIPRFSHSDAVFPDARTIFEANTIHPEATAVSSPINQRVPG